MAAQLAPVEAQIEQALGVSLCFRDPGVGHFGLVNALYPVGDKLLEVVCPTEEGTTAGRLLDKRGGDGGYMVIFQVDDLDELRRRCEAAQARVVFEATAEGVTGLHLHPRDLGGAIVSVDQTDDWEAWPWAGPDWQSHVRTDVVTDIAAVEIHAHDPASMAARWHEVLGGDLAGTTLTFDEGSIQFTPAGPRGEGVAALQLTSAGADATELELCGTTIRLVPAH